MSTSKKPVPVYGWMRALLFLVVFTGLYLIGRWLYNQTKLDKTVSVVYAGAAIFALTTILILPLFRYFIDKKPLLSLGFSWRLPEPNSINNSNHGITGLLMAMAILCIGWLTLYLTNHLEYHGAIISPQNLTSTFILMCVIAIAEEAVFRGYLLNNLLESFNPLVALMISALLFAFLHSGNPEAGLLALINVFLAGILLGISYIYTRNLWFAIFFHLSWNFVQGPILGFPVSGLELPSVLQVTFTGNKIVTGGKFGFEGSVIQTILFVFASIILYLFYRNLIPPNSGLRETTETEQSEI